MKKILFASLLGLLIMACKTASPEYVNELRPGSADVTETGMVMLVNGAQADSRMYKITAQFFTEQKWEVVMDVFSDKFYAEQKFRQVWDKDTVLVRNENLARFMDYLSLIRITTVHHNADKTILMNTDKQRVSCTLEMKIIDTRTLKPYRRILYTDEAYADTYEDAYNQAISNTIMMARKKFALENNPPKNPEKK